MSANSANHLQPRVGIIATLLSTAATYRGAGIHIYSRQLLQHLVERERRISFTAFVSDDAYPPPPGLSLVRSAHLTRSRLGRIIWEQTALPFLARSRQIDLWHGLAYALPLTSARPGVVTIHDLSFLRYPQAFNASNRLYLSRITALSSRRAQRVIAVSEATAGEVHELLGVPRNRIDVVYNGVDDDFSTRPAVEIETYREQAGWPQRFILSVGTLEPRKNYPSLLRAYALYRQMSSHPLPLLIGGGKGWRYEEVYKLQSELRLEESVRFLGYVAPEQLPWLYNAAQLFVYPSLYEGFGLPVAEAMACGTPVITSTESSLPEVAGDAALIVSPYEVEEMAVAMRDILSDDARRQSMITAGLEQSRQFHWSRTAAQTAEIYQRVGGW
ncbi:MAG: glycosyltransferase family 4 protein [Caldilineales bacterium]|nr:glycosyltransferase family 4 protein [Caldilineales bacterium]